MALEACLHFLEIYLPLLPRLFYSNVENPARIYRVELRDGYACDIVVQMYEKHGKKAEF